MAHAAEIEYPLDRSLEPADGEFRVVLLRGALGKSTKVAADFAALDFISSAGLRAVIQAARAAQAAKVEFVICSLSAPVRKAFDMSGLQSLLQIRGEVPC